MNTERLKYHWNHSSPMGFLRRILDDLIGRRCYNCQKRYMYPVYHHEFWEFWLCGSCGATVGQEMPKGLARTVSPTTATRKVSGA